MEGAVDDPTQNELHGILSKTFLVQNKRTGGGGVIGKGKSGCLGLPAKLLRPTSKFHSFTLPK